MAYTIYQAGGDQSDPNDLQELNENDINDLEEQDDNSDLEEVTDSEADSLATDTHDFENEDIDPIDAQLMSYIMSGNQQQESAPSKQYGGNAGMGSASTVYGDIAENKWLTNRTNNIKFAGFNQNRSKYAASLPTPSAIRDQSSFDTIKDNAIQSISNDPVAQKMGVNVMGNAKMGGAYSTNYQTGGRYTFPGQERTKQFGGDTLFANSEAVMRQGLNNDNYQKAVLNLKGNNTIRGLDNHQPVAVTDGRKYQVLHGPKDTAQFNGKVFEKRV